MKKLLLIEDDKIVSSIYASKFKSEGFEVAGVPDGATGIRMVQEFAPDVVILDLMGPELNGVEVISRIRSLPARYHVPIIVFSNAYLPQLVEDARKAGADYILTKSSTSAAKLTATVHEALAEKGAVRPQKTAVPSPETSSSRSQRRQPKSPVGDHTDSPSPQALDESFMEDLQKTLLANVPQIIISLRGNLQALNKADQAADKTVLVLEMYRKIHALSSTSAMTRLKVLTRIASALEAFLLELYQKPEHLNLSVNRTIAQAVDFLANILKHGPGLEKVQLDKATILVVDDDLFSRRAVVFALEKVNFKPVSLDDPLAASRLLEETQFDLVLLDIDMPGMNGLELCKKIKTIPLQKQTPVLFISAMSDFQSRAQSALSGGADLIGKPFLFLELGLKALLHIARKRVSNIQMNHSGEVS